MKFWYKKCQSLLFMRQSVWNPWYMASQSKNLTLSGISGWWPGTWLYSDSDSRHYWYTPRFFCPLPLVCWLVDWSVTIHFSFFAVFGLTTPVQMLYWPQIWSIPTRTGLGLVDIIVSMAWLHLSPVSDSKSRHKLAQNLSICLNNTIFYSFKGTDELMDGLSQTLWSAFNDCSPVICVVHQQCRVS